ncbi:hypothetical protein [Saccharothrix deserti]|uniref:hypothetical protein n=1 Tax=Saccharothrix deserti TaxID=2593674 RepID=UPI00131B7542|nr:hypothetical protein [Saccharothrix deserti]
MQQAAAAVVDVLLARLEEEGTRTAEGWLAITPTRSAVSWWPRRARRPALRGGTADVVNAARHRRIPVTVVWPHGATRD